MKLSREPARYITLGASILAALVVQGIITPAEMDVYLRIIVAVVMIALPQAGAEVVRSRVIPVDEEQTSYTPLSPGRR